MPLPTDVGTGTITGRFVIGVIDSPYDQDNDPELIPAQGRISFTPSIQYVPNSSNEFPMTIMKSTITGVLDEEGYLCTPDNTDPTGYTRGVKLFATDVGQVVNWTYNVRYNFQTMNSVSPSIPDHSISVPNDSTQDLTTLVRVPSSPGLGTPQMESLVIQSAENARLAAESALQAEQAASSTDSGVHALITDPQTQTGGAVEDLLNAKADVSDLTEGLSTKADTTYVDQRLSIKADKTYVDSELNGKVNSTTYTSGMDSKADKQAVTDSLALKSDKTYVDQGLSTKADTQSVTNSLALKSDKTYVDTELGKKVSTTTYTSGLSTKVNTTTYTAGLATKADAQSVTNSLALKANITDVPTFSDLTKDFVHNTPFPWIIGHRSGKWLYPEESREAVQACVDKGFIPEVDLWPLSDGTLVCIHDSTVQRTMTGTGSVSSFNLSDWKKLRVLPPVTGGNYGTPLTFEEYLQRWGNQSLLCAEVKDAAQAAVVGDLVEKYNLKNGILLQSFDITAARLLVSRGFTCTLLLSTALPVDTTPESLYAEGFRFVSPRNTMTDAITQSLVNANLNVIPWNYNTPVEADHGLSLGVKGYFTDDPWVSSRQPFSWGVDPWRNGLSGGLPQPHSSTGAYGDNGVYWKQRLTKGGYEIIPQAEAEGTTARWLVFAEHPWSPKIDTSQYFSVTCEFDVSEIIDPLGKNPESDLNVNTNTTGFFLYNNPTDSLYFRDGAQTGQNGYMFGLRRDGRMHLWRYVNGASAVKISTNPSEEITPTTPLYSRNTSFQIKLSLTYDIRGLVMEELVSGQRWIVEDDGWRPGLCRVGTRHNNGSRSIARNLTLTGNLY